MIWITTWRSTATRKSRRVSAVLFLKNAIMDMTTPLKKIIKIKVLIVSILVPLGLNIYGLIWFLITLAGGGYGIFPKRLVEISADLASYTANWPSIFIRIYPYTLSQEGEVVYDIFAWQHGWISLINSIGWYLFLMLSGFLMKKWRTRLSQS